MRARTRSHSSETGAGRAAQRAPGKPLTGAYALRRTPAAGPRTSAELAKETGTHPPSLYRLLRALASLGAVTQQDEDLFEPTLAGAALKSDDPGSVRGLLRLFCGPEVWKSWGGLPETVRSGEPAWDRLLGMNSFECP